MGYAMRGMVKRFSNDPGDRFAAGQDGIRRYGWALDTEGERTPRVGHAVVFKARANGAAPTRVNPWAASAAQRSRRADRIDCPHCGMVIVPRLVIYDGTPTQSVCPFCAGIVRDFRKPGTGLKWVGYVLAGLATLFAFQLFLAFHPVSTAETSPSPSFEHRGG